MSKFVLQGGKHYVEITPAPSTHSAGAPQFRNLDINLGGEYVGTLSARWVRGKVRLVIRLAGLKRKEFVLVEKV